MKNIIYIANGSKYCKAELESVIWDYISGGTFKNDNIDGFEPPNVKYNELDYTVKYEFKIFDVVSDYDKISPQNTGSWHGEIDSPDNTEWVDKWNQLQREGWDTWGQRNKDHPYGIPEKIIFTAGPFTQGPDTEGSMKAIIEDGFTFRFA